MDNEFKYDEHLWFTYSGCEGNHFLLDNPHTHIGRIMAWCPVKQRTFFVSKSEIKDCSIEAKYWIKGFLKGNQPEPPRNGDGDVDFSSEEYIVWLKAIKLFDRTGYWWSGETRFCENCNGLLLASEPDVLCENCRILPSTI